MKIVRKGVVLGGIALLAAAIGYWAELFDRSPSTNYTNASPPLIPELILSDLGGHSQNLGQWRGKLLIVNYWATWCHPCREEMPGFSRLHDKYRDKGVQFVGIGIDNVVKIKEFQKTSPVSYPLLVGDIGTMEQSARLGNTKQALPFTAVFDREGNLALTRLGRFQEADLERYLLELISR